MAHIALPSLARKPNLRIWYAFLLINLLEFFLFKAYITRNITAFYPSGFDQAGFLLLSYQLFEKLKQHGPLAELVALTPPTGALFTLQAALGYFFFGVSRFSALLFNLLYFIALQFFALLALRSLSKRTELSFLFLGLILGLQTPFIEAGGLMDFRMDFIAFCMYGIFVCTTIKSQFFLNRNWSLVTGCVAALCILLRCITVAYLCPVLGLMLLYFFYAFKKTPPQESTQKAAYRAQLLNLILTCLIIALSILPYLWFYKEPLYHYYVGNHVLSNEKYVRALEAGVNNRFSELIYYPSALLGIHLGNGVLGLSLLSLLLCFFPSPKRNSTTPQVPSRPYWRQGFLFLLLCLLIPCLVLTADKSKSFVVASIMAIPLLWLMLWACLYADQGDKLKQRRWLLQLLATLALSYGLYNQFHELRHFPSKNKLRRVAPITQMYLDLGDYASAKQWETIPMSVDQVIDYLVPAALVNLYYEAHGKFLKAAIAPGGLGSSLWSVDKATALRSLQKSKVFIVNLENYPQGSFYPFNQTVSALKPLLLNFAKQHFVRLGDYQFMDSTYRVYVAPY